MHTFSCTVGYSIFYSAGFQDRIRKSRLFPTPWFLSCYILLRRCYNHFSSILGHLPMVFLSTLVRRSVVQSPQDGSLRATSGLACILVQPFVSVAMTFRHRHASSIGRGSGRFRHKCAASLSNNHSGWSQHRCASVVTGGSRCARTHCQAIWTSYLISEQRFSRTWAESCFKY